MHEPVISEVTMPGRRTWIAALLILLALAAGCAVVAGLAITQGTLWTSTLPPPTATIAPVPPAPADVGEVAGRIALPHESAAAVNLFFENTATEAVTVVALEPGQRTYAAILPPGVYLAYTWLPPAFSEKGAFTDCRPGEPCTDHSLRPFTVTVGATVSGVDITDWYTPAGAPLVVAGTLVDGTGADPVPDAALVIREQRIVAVGPRAGAPANAQTVAVPQTTILPGFINTHVHNAYRAQNLQTWAQAGVTTVRDVGAPAGTAYFIMRDRLRTDPRNAWLIASGPLVTVPGGYPIAGNNFPSLTVTSPADARDKIGSLIDDGADVIKITLTADAIPTLSPEEAAAIVKTAHRRGIPVTVHATDARNRRRSLDAGVDDVAHIATDPVPDEDIRRMVAAGVYWVPTFEPLRGAGQDNLRRFMAAGGQLALGNAGGYLSGIQIGMPMTEIEWMQTAGMTPMQIIVAATRNGARVCRREGAVGTLQIGKLADVLVVDGDPLQDLQALSRVRLVMHRGVIIRPTSESQVRR
jgi:imidazolonepropionase-like amidohydrolase